MEGSLPLHLCNVHKFSIIINRSYTLIHSIAILFLIYYRVSFLFFETKTRPIPILPWLLVLVSELLLSFIWLLGQAFRWRSVSRTVFPERLPKDDKLPAIDVFICTADPNREPTVHVMNTVLSAMALDYPPEKLHVYLSDDGGAAITLLGMRETWKFAKWWLPFCRKYGIKTRSPEAYFSGMEDDQDSLNCTEFMSEREKIKEKYELFKERVIRGRDDGVLEDKGINASRDHPSVIEVIQENSEEEQVKMPLLIYVSREKRPSYPHHFKAGALNVLLRVSGVLSNSPYILVLDCDMYCNDPTSPRQAMCFHLDPKISSTLAFVQFPQKFNNISENDIYDSQIRNIFWMAWYGMDGLKGPVLSGTNFYVKREALYGSSVQKGIFEGIDLTKHKRSFGPSNDFIRSLRRDYKPRTMDADDSLSIVLQETKVLASCAYENHTQWGEEVGFRYHSVVEDYFTGFNLHCQGWTSVYLNPPRPQFLGTSTTNLNDVLIQWTRWCSGLVEVGFSRFCPIIYGPLRMSFLESLCYAQFSFFPICYCVPLWCFATIPQLCLLNGIPLYPEVSNSYFKIYLFIFLSAISQHIYEVLITGGSIRIWINEQRIWMMKSITCHLYGSLDAIMKKLGMREASFLPTNKVMDDEQVKLYQMGIFDFQASRMLLAPLVALVILNMASFIRGVIRMIVGREWDQMFVQVFLSFYILVMNYAIIEGMILRKDKGRIPPSTTRLSAIISVVFLSFGSIVLLY